MRLRAGTSLVRTRGLPRSGLVRVVIDTGARGTARRQSSAWAFAGPRSLGVAEARRVLEVWARRLSVGFELAVAHGVDRCVSHGPTVVRCRWSTGGSEGRPTERQVDVVLGPSGYTLVPGPRRPSPKQGRNVLGAVRLGATFVWHGISRALPVSFPPKDISHSRREILMSNVTLRRRAAAATAIAALGALAFAGPAAAAISNAPSPYLPGQGSTSNANAQGIIMSDGRICNPRWGC